MPLVARSAKAGFRIKHICDCASKDVVCVSRHAPGGRPILNPALRVSSNACVPEFLKSMAQANAADARAVPGLKRAAFLITSGRAVFTTEARELVQARRHHVLLYQRASSYTIIASPFAKIVRKLRCLHKFAQERGTRGIKAISDAHARRLP